MGCGCRNKTKVDGQGAQPAGQTPSGQMELVKYNGSEPLVFYGAETGTRYAPSPGQEFYIFVADMNGIGNTFEITL